MNMRCLFQPHTAYKNGGGGGRLSHKEASIGYIPMLQAQMLCSLIPLPNLWSDQMQYICNAGL